LVIALPPAQVTVERLFSADAHKIWYECFTEGRYYWSHIVFYE